MRVNGTLISTRADRVSNLQPLGGSSSTLDHCTITGPAQLHKLLTLAQSQELKDNTFDIQIMVRFNVARTIHCVRNCN